MKKEVLGFIIFLFLMSIIFIYGMNRFRDIDSGKIIVASQNEMDR